MRNRRLLGLVAAVLILPVLAACGSKVGYGDPTKSGFDAASISGDFTKEPTIKWNAELAYPDKTSTKTLIQGKGDTVKAGDVVSAYLYIADGTTKTKAYSDWDNGEPESMTNDSTNLSQFWISLLTGVKAGTRLAAVTNSNIVFGEAGNADLGIGTTDSLLVVVDVVSRADAPKPVTPKDVDPSTLPKIVEKDGKPTAFDFTGIPKPKADGDLLRAIVKKGSGAPVTADQTITANYLGMTYGAKTPFDESYSKTPLTSALSGLVKGWIDGLTGVPVGSRVILQIPPVLGYGDQATGSIPANSTLYFVLDIISAQ